MGFDAEHNRRDDLQVTLISPTGTEVRLLTDDGISGTDFQNARFDDAAPLDFSEVVGDQNPTGLDFENLARPDQPLSAFWGETAQGNWRLEVCDLNPATDDGAYLGSQLRLTPQDPHSKTGRWSQLITFAVEGLDYVMKEIQVYGQDVVGNRTVEPLRFDVIIDTVAPVITVTNSVTQGVVGNTAMVLEGIVSDGGPVTDLEVHVYPPEGEAYRGRVSRMGDTWQFELLMDYAGLYQLWVTAKDVAGNMSSVGPFEVMVKPPAQIHLPMVLSNFTSGPDLVVQHILVTENNVEIILINNGTAAVPDGFWVDLYINPDPVPTAVNQTWDQLGDQGLVWGVTDVSMLVPGGTLTLDLNHPSFMPDYSDFEGTFSPEMAIYVQVDSYALGDYGSVLELDEMNGGEYNNIKGPVFPLPISMAQSDLAAAPSGSDRELIKSLPERPMEVK